MGLSVTCSIRSFRLTRVRKKSRLGCGPSDSATAGIYSVLRRPACRIEVLSHIRKNRLKHFRGQDARIGVVAGAMVAAEERHGAHYVRRAMAERNRFGARSERYDDAVVGNAAQRHDGREIG